MLFAVETAVRIRDARTSTERANMWLPAFNSRAQYKRLREIDFTSSKKKKKRMDLIQPEINGQDKCETLPQAALPLMPAPTEDELNMFYSKVAASGVKPAILMVHPQYSALFEAPRNKEPQLFRNLACPEACSEDLVALFSRAEKFLEEIVISREMVEHVESSTRNQAKCAMWYAYRAGRITASVMKSVCCTSTDKPSVSLLKKICHPDQHKFSTPATTWGIDHEADAISSYVAEMRKQHASFTHSKSGLWLCSEHPYVAASPDASVECACCGKGTLEVKCPHSAATKGMHEASKNSDFCLELVNGSLRLKRAHAYYYQVQTKMGVCGVAYCDFVVWTPTELYIERVLKDDAFFQNMLASARKFFTHVVLPELFTECFTTKDTVKPTSSSDKDSCYCQGPESGKMVACDGDQCSYRWFHYTCLGIKRAPKEKVWLCRDCVAQKRSHQ